MEYAGFYYNHSDHLNSSSITTDDAGDITQTLDYYPYGDQRLNVKAGTFDTKHKYTNHQYDDDTDLTYMKARYYGDTSRRFFSIDPASRDNPLRFATDPQQLNSYRLMGISPIKQKNMWHNNTHATSS